MTEKCQIIKKWAENQKLKKRLGNEKNYENGQKIDKGKGKKDKKWRKIEGNIK